MCDEDIRRHAERLAALLTVSREVTTTTDLRTLYRKAVNLAKDLVGLDFSTLMILSPDKTTLTIEDTIGFPATTIGTFSLIEGQGLSTYVVRRKAPGIVTDFGTETRFEVPPMVVQNGIRSALCVPMMVEEEVFGVLIGHTLEKKEFTADYISLYQTIGNQSAVAIRNSMNISALADEKELLAVTLRSIGDGVITTDISGMVVLMNKVAEKLTGWTQEEARGKPLSEVFCIINEQTGETCGSPVEEVLRKGGAVRLASHTALMARDGRERLIADSAAPIFNRESSIIGVVLVFRDTTEKRKTERELMKAQKLESVGLLAGGIAHDFNNLLTAILGNIDVAKLHAAPGDTVYRRLTEAERATYRARDLTQQLLAFAKGGAPVKKAVALETLIREAAGFALRGSEVNCNFQIAADLRDAEIDEGQISQVIQNLVINADHAMPGGGTLSILAENSTLSGESGLPLKEGAYIRISVSDSGVGIPHEHLGRIFDPYFTTKQKGSGLGLATAYFIIRNHEGHIGVSSGNGKGSVFTVYLPASEGARPLQCLKEGAPARGSGRVLVMDDDEAIRLLAADMLKYLGYECVSVCNGSEALAAFIKAREEGRPFDAAILDLTIPGGKGGKETVRELLAVDPGAKVIVSSGYSNDPVMADYRQSGFKGVMVKPYRTADLGAVLRKVLSNED